MNDCFIYDKEKETSKFEKKFFCENKLSEKEKQMASKKYEITKYSYRQAKRLGVEIKPSTNKTKKLDVYNKKGEKIASIGAIGYKDYPTFLKENKKLATRRRKAYKIRHRKDRLKKGTPGFYADKILW